MNHVIKKATRIGTGRLGISPFAAFELLPMDIRDAEEILSLLDACISIIKWRLRPSAKRRLETGSTPHASRLFISIFLQYLHPLFGFFSHYVSVGFNFTELAHNPIPDVLALCTRLRAVVMVDYGGKMPELQDHLCALMSSMHKERLFSQQIMEGSKLTVFLLQECTLLLPLRIMVIEDMIYMVHVEGIAELSNLSLQQQLHFVDLEVDPPQLLLQTNQTPSMSEFVSLQKLFSSIFPCDAVVDTIHVATPLSVNPRVEVSEYNNNVVSIADTATSQPCGIFDLTSFLKDTQITIPGLNG
ncbi:hypothetical protein M5K25_010917 [Dendrobium thyrsiflorum]|uniref:Uncharacterized protein n=1 Tax=Dendrobium thyrsiflorum TaxID=117978 RepID=A0ABD0V1U8_DENTH